MPPYNKAKKAKSPYADGRPSKVNPDVKEAMKGKGGKRPKKKTPVRKKKATRAELMDKGRPLPPVKKKKKAKKKRTY